MRNFSKMISQRAIRQAKTLVLTELRSGTPSGSKGPPNSSINNNRTFAQVAVGSVTPASVQQGAEEIHTSVVRPKTGVTHIQIQTSPTLMSGWSPMRNDWLLGDDFPPLSPPVQSLIQSPKAKRKNIKQNRNQKLHQSSRSIDLFSPFAPFEAGAPKTTDLPSLSPIIPSTLGASFSEQGDTEDQDLSESTPDTPSAPGTSCTGSSLESSNEGEPTAVEETASTASTASSKAKKVLRTREEKRKRMSETDIELQKLEVLKKLAAKVDAEQTPDALTAFGNQVALEMRQIQDPGYLARLKRSIMIMIYDTQEAERNRSLSSTAQPTPCTFQPVISAPPPAQSHPHYSSARSPHQTFLQTLQNHDHYEIL
ncbi:hypothetical protein G5714_004242 [Onychostoma macrolepis]|uniref:Uncharacterized protein n=1 Tax=Onychostoma macrolepis TaxID=369639 RepID=A0A7J6D457_9TELE|nr:hypothetical protein G5714_004242 [Onychostoma macrolepis]